jgi:hypothetical protein
MPKNADKFICENCNFKCSKQSNWNIHILTAKHNQNNNNNNNNDLNAIINKKECPKCRKCFNDRAGLWRHKKKCTYVDTMNDDTTHELQQNIDIVDTSDASTILLLLKQNQEFKSLMVEQYTQLQESNQKNQESNQKNQELQQQLVDAVKNNTGSMTNCNNTTNNNNQQFNLNFFLNDTCKDAMNITDFLSNMDVHIDELEYIGNHGYVNGMTKMIMERLKEMDITKRPIHCTDIKRETMYIKDKDEWCKDTDELTKIRKILNRISMNNYRTIPEWKNAHPECEVVASRTYDFCYSMMEALLGDVEDDQLKLDNKIIKTMAKTLYVNKSNP